MKLAEMWGTGAPLSPEDKRAALRMQAELLEQGWDEAELKIDPTRDPIVVIWATRAGYKTRIKITLYGTGVWVSPNGSGTLEQVVDFMRMRLIRVNKKLKTE